MEKATRTIYAIAIVALLLVGTTQAKCTVKNNSSKDIVITPLVDANINIHVKVGAIVEIAPIHLDVIITNVGTGAKSAPIKLPDASIVVCVDGLVNGTISLYLGGLVNGVLSILGNILVSI